MLCLTDLVSEPAVFAPSIHSARKSSSLQAPCCAGVRTFGILISILVQRPRGSSLTRKVILGSSLLPCLGQGDVPHPAQIRLQDVVRRNAAPCIAWPVLEGRMYAREVLDDELDADIAQIFVRNGSFLADTKNRERPRHHRIDVPLSPFPPPRPRRRQLRPHPT